MPTLTVQVAADYDDVTAGPSGFWPNNYNCNFMGHSSGNGFLNAGFRFLNVTIPKGAVIISAKLSVYSAYAVFFKVDANGRVYGEAADNPATWTNTAPAHRPDTATPTTASEEWSPAAWEDGQWYDSPDLSSVIAEITGRAGWASGNALCLMWRHAMPPDYGDDAFCSVVDFDGSAINCPKLTVEYAAVKPYYYFAQQ
jgi:type IV pilus assembly protein PilY1